MAEFYNSLERGIVAQGLSKSEATQVRRSVAVQVAITPAVRAEIARRALKLIKDIHGLVS